MIRRATIDDIQEINNLGKKLHNNFEKLFHIETEINNKDAIVLSAIHNNKIIGYLYALLTPDNVDLISIVVDDNMRCQHIGTKLIQELIKNAPDKTITLEVSSNNKPAIMLYKKNNFIEIAIRKKYYEDSDAIIMKWGN